MVSLPQVDLFSFQSGPSGFQKGTLWGKHKETGKAEYVYAPILSSLGFAQPLHIHPLTHN